MQELGALHTPSHPPTHNTLLESNICARIPHELAASHADVGGWKVTDAVVQLLVGSVANATPAIKKSASLIP